MTLKFLKSGLYTTVQDLGRVGYQQNGVIIGGAMDPLTLKIGNILVGNKPGDAGFEITMIGPSIRFGIDSLIAITGADLSPKIDGLPVKMWRPVLVKKGAILSFGKCVNGMRAYLTVGGGIDVPTVMGSKSTYVRAKVGGLEGRPIKMGDQVEIGAASSLSQDLKRLLDISSRSLSSHPFIETLWSTDYSWLPYMKSHCDIHVLPGKELIYFSPETRHDFFETPFRVSTHADRMGYRLEGKRLPLIDSYEMISEPITAGTIQVPPEGQPIILMADSQTIGGYPRIAQVANADIPLLAQTKPGDELRFKKIDLKESFRRLKEQEDRLNWLKHIISLKVK